MALVVPEMVHASVLPVTEGITILRLAPRMDIHKPIWMAQEAADWGSDIVRNKMHKCVDTDKCLVHFCPRMRDDIHKSAPVSRAWRSFMKHCAREADRKERAADSAYRALAKDCKSELSPAFLEKLRGNLSDPQAKLFVEGVAESCISGTIERGAQVMEQAVLGHLSRREACGQSGRAAVLGAIGDAVVGRKDSQFRAMEGHWMKKGGESARPAVTAAKEILQSLSSAEIASRILDGKLDPGKPNRGVSLEEDLQ